MALADIARFDKNKPISLRDISLRQGISINYLEQLFLKLKKNNIVKSVRGKNGGYVLSKSAKDINLSDILFAVEEKVKTLKGWVYPIDYWFRHQLIVCTYSFSILFNGYCTILVKFFIYPYLIIGRVVILVY